MNDNTKEVQPSIRRNTLGPAFDDVLAESGLTWLVRAQPTTLQMNLGKLCNQACRHCHVDAGPKLKTEIMGAEVVERTLAVLAASEVITTVDITGGAPELNAHFRRIVVEVRKLGRQVIDRCNLSVLFEPGMEPLAEFLAEHHVEIFASLPCYTAENVDKQRGRGIFDKSIRAIRLLNSFGYGMPGSMLSLSLVHNPLGAFLPPSQERLEGDYRRQLREQHGVEFTRLFTMTNMPIRRFAHALSVSAEYETYMGLLRKHFNRSTLANLMCRSLISVGWNGKLYDCDFNQMLGVGIGARAESIWDIGSFDELAGIRIVTGLHCFGCTAGCGSSCGGSLQ